MKRQKWMYFIAIFGPSWLYVQAYKILSTKQTAGLAALAYVITLVSATCWLIYGLMQNDPIIKLSGTLSVIGSILVLYLIFAHSGNKIEEKIIFDKKSNRHGKDILKAYTDRRGKNKSKRWFFVKKQKMSKYRINNYRNRQKRNKK